MIATGLPIPLRDEEVLHFVVLHGKALAARLFGMSQRGLDAVLRDIAQRGQAARPEPPVKVGDEAVAEALMQFLTPGPAQEHQGGAGPTLPERLSNATALGSDTDGAGSAPSSAFKAGDLVEVVLQGPHLGKRGRVERLKAEGVVVRLDGVGKRLCEPEQIRKVPTRPRGPCPEVRRLMQTVLKGKPRAAIRAFRTLTTLNEMNEMALVRRMIELSRIGRPGVAGAAAQALAAAHRAKRRAPK